MDQYLFTVIALLVFGVVGMVVGVANDAVNFMNSSIGAKAAPRKWVIVIAGLGILFGVTFSGGMMEVARKGIFNPEFFIFSELLVIFMAVMIQNVLLLDLYNTFGLPTSTTVSVVFGLFGGAVAMALIKVGALDQDLSQVFTYINTKKVSMILAGILLSVVFSFIVGAIVQYLSRLLFSFSFKKALRRYGAVWSGIALTAIIYFILIKGSKGATFMTDDVKEWISANNFLIMLISFGFWAIVSQILMSFTKINILKFVTLVGTFALAMAFAANDLVNFIGAPLAGLEGYKLAIDANIDPGLVNMAGLDKKIPANPLILLFAGAVMVSTLFINKKSRTVTKTELSLGRQDIGYERFESYMFSRMVVRMVIAIIDSVSKITPEPLRKAIAKRFDSSKFVPERDTDGDPQMFDLVRATVNVMVAAILISIATSMKLPLSTTYVTFIVAMATALVDRSWGRESAVYRVSGVITVIGGWFMTAIIAAIFAMVVAFILYYGGFYAMIALIALCVFLIIRSTRLHKERENEKEEDKDNEEITTMEEAYEATTNRIAKFFGRVTNVLGTMQKGIEGNNLKTLKKSAKQAKKTAKKSSAFINDMLRVIQLTEKDELEYGNEMAQTLGSLHEIAHRMRNISLENFTYIDNNHQQLSAVQIEEFGKIQKKLFEMLNQASLILMNSDYKKIPEVAMQKDDIMKFIEKCNKNQINRIKKSSSNTRRSILYLGMLDDMQAITDHSGRLLCFVQKLNRAEGESSYC